MSDVNFKELVYSMVGGPPVFNPSEQAEPQIEAWKAWSARTSLVLKANAQIREHAENAATR